MFLSAESLHWLAMTVQEIYAARTYGELNRQLVSRLHARFNSIISVCESASHDGSQLSLDRMAGCIPVVSDYALYLWDHPNVIRLLSGSREPVLHLRETVNRNAFERTDYFNALCRHNSLHDQILTVAWQSHRLTSFAVNRDRLFTTEERELLHLLQPHANAALHRVKAHEDAQASPFGHPWIELGPDRQPLGLTPAQGRVLQAYFPDWRPESAPLPGGMTVWLHDCVRKLAAGAPPRPLCALFVEAARGRLGVRYHPGSTERGAALRLTEMPAGAAKFWRMSGLTPREREVLGWLAQGKRNAEIALILGVAPDTVGKHVERVFKKLGVHSRSAAGALHDSP